MSGQCKALTLSDAEVMHVMRFAVAESLPSGSAIVEALGIKMEVDMAKCWKPDQTFLDLLRDKAAINAMLGDIAGKHVADGNVSATAKVQKSIIADCLDGKRKPTKVNWQPRYMAFPMRSYTKQGGIRAIDHWNAVKRQYK